MGETNVNKQHGNAYPWETERIVLLVPVGTRNK